MPSESFRDIPELFESSLEESLKARTKSLSKRAKIIIILILLLIIIIIFITVLKGTFNQLGPADLVHVVKTIPNSRHHIKEVPGVCGAICSVIQMFLGFQLSLRFGSGHVIIFFNCCLH
jgi:hypothetical protein